MLLDNLYFHLMQGISNGFRLSSSGFKRYGLFTSVSVMALPAYVVRRV